MPTLTVDPSNHKSAAALPSNDAGDDSDEVVVVAVTRNDNKDPKSQSSSGVDTAKIASVKAAKMPKSRKVASRNDSADNYVGRRLVKHFEPVDAPAGWFYGVVDKSFNKSKEYHVSYDDDDSEVMSLDEMLTCFKHYEKQKRRDPHPVSVVVTPANDDKKSMKRKVGSTEIELKASVSTNKAKDSPVVILLDSAEDDDEDESVVEVPSPRTKKVRAAATTSSSCSSHSSSSSADSSFSDQEAIPEFNSMFDYIQKDTGASKNRRKGSLTASNNKSTTTKKATVTPKKATVAPQKASTAKKTTTTSVNAFGSLKSPKTIDDAADFVGAIRSNFKKPYTGGDGLPIITEPQDMFDDMIGNLFNANNLKTGKKSEQGTFPALMKLLVKLYDRPLRVATMCSGTESPVLALDMMQKSIRDVCVTHLSKELKSHSMDINRVFEIDHVFSCEIEPFKQAYIERNFQPPLLFRDIRDLGNEQAHTAYGALMDVPRHIDLLVAGTSCVDYSGLNNRKKTIDEGGESGQTFEGLMNWVEKAKPSIVILENVYNAPWDKMILYFEELGYASTFHRFDTKDYYVPQTRQRGYLFAVKRKGEKDDRPELWKKQVQNLKRSASAPLDAFMLSNDDPRVLRARERLTSESRSSTSSAGRTDWTKCETRHQIVRFEEDLGDQRPLTCWSESGNTCMPGFAWNDWVSTQVHRILDLLDINTLKLAKDGVDCTFKTMVWNVSQNADRDTMGRPGSCQCLTPTGVFYVTNRGGPLTGEELLALQGIPANDLLLTRESEEELKDLAGNAMTTTVVGACILCALPEGHKSINSGYHSTAGSNNIKTSVIPRDLVPRPLHYPTETRIVKLPLSYKQIEIDLCFQDKKVSEWREMLKKAMSSVKQCLTEGPYESIPSSQLMKCKLCGLSARRCHAIPARKFEEHDFEPWYEGTTRTDPRSFEEQLLPALPMCVQFTGMKFEICQEYCNVTDKKWQEWLQIANNAIQTTETIDDDEGGESDEVCSPIKFFYTHLQRSHIWTAHYTSRKSSRLEMRITKSGFEWLLFAKSLQETENHLLSDARPLARLKVPIASNSAINFDIDRLSLSPLNGTWEICAPENVEVSLKIEGSGQLIPSWRQRIGLKGEFENECQYERLTMTLENHDKNGNNVDDELKQLINGQYICLPKCGTACSSLMKKEDTAEPKNAPVYFFLESGRKSSPKDDLFVFADSSHRVAYGEYRAIYLMIDPSFEYRPVHEKDPENERTVKALIPGRWIKSEATKLDCPTSMGKITNSVPSLNADIKIRFDDYNWKTSFMIVNCNIPISKDDKLFAYCKRLDNEAEVNLQKSTKLLEQFAFVTSRFSVHNFAEDGKWLTLSRKDVNDLQDKICERCSPEKPSVVWTTVKKGNSVKYAPIEDVKKAATFERHLKSRPEPWVIRLQIDEELPFEYTSQNGLFIMMQIGCNVVSLVNRALGRFPKLSLARQSMKSSPLVKNSYKKVSTIYEWRIVSHYEKTHLDCGKLWFTSNKMDQEADQPPCFINHKLRTEQLRSLKWMIHQEESPSVFYEEEVAEAVLPGLNWRAEGRVCRPVLVRGGIVADEVGYGKTAITLGLIDSSKHIPDPPEELRSHYIHTKATIVVVPGDLMNQWPEEIKKFLGLTKKVIAIKDMKSYNKLTIKDIVNADIVVVNFTLLSKENYYEQLCQLCGVDCSGMPKNDRGGRLFDDIYKKCLNRLQSIVQRIINDTKTACDYIFDLQNNHMESIVDGNIVMDGKKSAYKSASVNKETKNKSISDDTKVADIWDLKTPKFKSAYKNMRAPPLEMFFWNRLVVDEFTYLSDIKRERVLSVMLDLKSSYRWCLSGTPKHANFNDIKCLSSLLGIHLGIDEVLPGMKVNSRSNQMLTDATNYENLALYLETRSMQWHERRHVIAQDFMKQFVRQNKPEHDEIPSIEYVIPVKLPPAERAIYLELETYLRSLDMNNKLARKSKQRSTSDRDSRMQMILQNSSSAEEALLKCCSHFDFENKRMTALETINDIVELRKEELHEHESKMKFSIAAAFLQESKILAIQSGWNEVKKSEKGEIENALVKYQREIEAGGGVPHGADHEVYEKIKRIIIEAKESYKSNSTEMKNCYLEIYKDDDAEELEGSSKKKAKMKKSPFTKSKTVSPEEKYKMKKDLRNHMHFVRAYGKELCGRVRSLRYIQSIQMFQKNKEAFDCSRCNRNDFSIDQVGILSSCGHTGCLSCLEKNAANNICVEVLRCSARVSPEHVVKSSNLGLDEEEVTDTKNNNNSIFGSKLCCIIDKVKEIIDKGDRLIIFYQFDDLGKEIANALKYCEIKASQVKGSVGQRTKTTSVFQKEKPDKDDPHVLLLKLDDEQSAGLNLTKLNHAIFVHPLLAASQVEYEAYQTQAIGRIRRYGQSKTVEVHRFLACDTIDTKIYKERTGEEY